ncbi:MAG: hypothetical protein ACI4B5_04810 [Bacteroidaceae bacterium]
MEEGDMTGVRTCLADMLVAVRFPSLLSWMGVLAVMVLMLLPVQLGFCQAEIVLPVLAATLAVVAWVMMMVRRTVFRFAILDALLATWLLYVLLRAGSTPDVPCFPVVSRALSLMMLYVGLRMLFSSAGVSVLMVERSFMTFALLEGLFCIGQLLLDGSRHTGYPFTGTFLNPGPCSAVLFMGVFLGLYSLYLSVSSRNAFPFSISSVLPVSTLIVCSLLLPMGWSRAALVSVCCVLTIAMWHRMPACTRRLALVGLLSILLLLYLFKRGSADGRLLFYMIASSAVAGHPLFGSGIGSFFQAYARETASLHSQLPLSLVTHADGVEYALSDGMRVAVEQGIVGLIFAISFTFIVLSRLRSISISLMLMLLGLLIFSLFSYPFQLLPFQLLFVLLAALVASPMATDGQPDVAIHPAGGRLSGMLLCVMVAGLAFVLTPPISRRVEAARESRLIVGQSNPRMLAEYRRLMPWMYHDASFLFRYGQMLASCGKYNESNYVLWQGSLVSGDPMFHVLRGHNYRHMHAYDQARRAYLQAHGQSPSRQYPLFCLMRLYRDIGLRREAVRMATVLLHMPTQQSPLARQIRVEAQNCIEEQ